ncbi:MAG: hypothetical protein HQ518_22190, partial [Rhodopirellula sp.]|nr:hypothetical protein [Rhodopirellula sp.]
MDARPQKKTANYAEGGLMPRSDVEFDLESLWLRPVAAEFHSLCEASDRPVDVFRFVLQNAHFSPQDCVDALLADQHRRHGQEATIPAETYCAFLRNRAGRSAAQFEWQIVAREFLLSLKASESTADVTLKNFCDRFPEFQSQLVQLSRSDGLSETLMIDPTCSFGSGHEPTVAASTQ